MFVVSIRTGILYLLVVITMRLMGKRQIGELQPYEFVITIMISDLASLPMQDTRLPLLQGIIPIITLLFLKTVLTQIGLKFQWTRKFVDGEPCILIHNGKINYSTLKKQQLNIDELLEELRLANYFNLDEIQYAILENDGQMSILPVDYNSSKKSSGSNASSQNAEVKLPQILISDGKVNKNSLTSIDKDEKWILDLLKKHNIASIKHVLIALYDTEGKFKFQLFDKYEKRDA
jgi:Predicted membrane protein